MYSIHIGGLYMKKVILITIVMISFFTFTGCKKEEYSLIQMILPLTRF